MSIKECINLRKSIILKKRLTDEIILQNVRLTKSSGWKVLAQKRYILEVVQPIHRCCFHDKQYLSYLIQDA